MADLLVVCPLNALMRDALGDAFNIVQLADLDDPHAWLAANGARFELVFTDGHCGLRPDLMALLPNLKVISTFGVGYDAIDTAATNARGVWVTHTPGVLSEDVATTALMLLMACYRDMRQATRIAHSGDWARTGGAPLARSMDNRTIGVLGFGRIGQAIARKLLPWNPEILYCARGPKDVAFEFVGDVITLAQRCDALIAITPGGAETHHMIDAQVMAALGPDGVLINVGRGSVVDEAALIAALESDALGWAGLDVFEDEPNIPPALRDHPRTVLTPHIASGTVETRRAMAQLAVENLVQFERKGHVVSPVPECAHLAKTA